MMYEEELKKYLENTQSGVIRSFYGQCPECGERIFSIDDYPKDGKIKAKFICKCGKKFIKTVYPSKNLGYRYPQALVVTANIQGKERKALQLKNKLFYVNDKNELKTKKR